MAHNIGASSEVTLRKCASRSRFQILLEPDCARFIREFQDNIESPWPPISRMRTSAFVVRGQPGGDIGCQACVIPRGLDFTPQDVDEALAQRHRTQTLQGDSRVLASDSECLRCRGYKNLAVLAIVE